jgi:hypothetical protein
MLKKKIWVNVQRIIQLFTQKIVTKLSNVLVWDPGSGKNLFRIPDPGSRGQKGNGARIRIRNTDFKGQFNSNGTAPSPSFIAVCTHCTYVPYINTGLGIMLHLAAKLRIIIDPLVYQPPILGIIQPIHSDYY